MTTTALLVSTATVSYAAARMPLSLSRAGFEVALLTPRNALAEHCGAIAKIAFLPDRATPREWVHAFAGTVRGVGPDLVLPCDDTAYRLLYSLATSPPPDLAPALHEELATLIADSLGDPRHFRQSVDKTLLFGALAPLGVPVPPFTIIGAPEEAEPFVAQHGFPVVLKRSHSTAGSGVAVCGDPDTLLREFKRLASGAGLDFRDVNNGRLLLQAFVSGPTRYFEGVAWRGELLQGRAVDKLDGDPHGPASVVRYVHDEALWQASAAIARAFGINGVFAPEFIVDPRTGTPYVVEINRRVSPGTHRGAFVDCDAAKALHAALTGAPPSTRARLDDGEAHVFVHFPYEWLRHPGSRWLTRFPVDAPWEEPDLIEAMIAMRTSR